MKAARDVDDVIAERFGRHRFGRHYLVWCADPTVGGMVFWGTPDERDVAELVRIFAVPMEPGRDPRYDLVTDGRRVDRISKVAFDPLSHAAVARLREQQHVLLKRHAVIAPGGLVGTIMAGFFPLFDLGEQHRIFREPEEAYRWLDRPALCAEVDALVAAEVSGSQVVAELRRWLTDHLLDASVDAAARALGRSARTLQRELGEAGTRFRSELDLARVEMARLRLADSDDKLESVARDVGCASLSSFSRLFRRVGGESPTDYRNRSR